MNDDSDRAAEPGVRVNAAHDIQSDLCEARVFHVDANEILRGAGVLDEVFGDGLCQLRRLFEAHLRELDADVGVEGALGNGVEQSVIDVGSAVRLSGRSDAFAKRVERDGDALAVDGFRDAKRIFGLHACDESRIEPSSQRGVLTEAAKRTVVRERNKYRKSRREFPRNIQSR